MRGLRLFAADRQGASAAEFALVLPLFLLFLFGLIDAGRYAWLLNELEKGTQAGARYAVVTDLVATGLNSYNPVGFACPDGPVATADRICPGALGSITCRGSGGVSCQCDRAPCPGAGPGNAAAFANIVARVSQLAPAVRAADVAVTYSGSGLGFAGDPAVTDAGAPLSDIAPVVTVAVSGVEFRALVLFGGTIDMPPVSASLTLEDGTGNTGY